MIETKHDCRSNVAWHQAGPAIDHCTEDEHGFFWAGNGEYESQVACCPICGREAPAAPVGQEEWEDILKKRNDG